MKTLLRTLIILFLAGTANAQFAQLTNFTGTLAYGTYNVTVTRGGSFSTGGGICFGPPLEYWAGPGGPGWYTYVPSKPVYAVKVRTWGINGGPLGAGEYVQMYINGAPYALQPTDVSAYTECSPGGGPMYIWTGEWMGPVGTTGDYNGGDFTITKCSGINSFELWCNGSLSGVAYWIFMDTVKPTGCTNVIANSPCFNDTLKLDMVGDSTGATYAWKGPGGFTSTLQGFDIYPATFADTGWYYVIKTIGSVIDTDSTYVIVHPKPYVTTTNNSPLCSGLIDTLKLYASPDSAGEKFAWTGPNIYTDTLEFPVRVDSGRIVAGTYTVVTTTPFGCKDTGYTTVTLITRPGPPIISGITPYCQGIPFVPFTVTTPGVTGSTLEWYTVGTGGAPGTIPLVVNTSVVGTTTDWVSQRISGCESPRASFTTRVITTPAAPVVTGPIAYCQFIGPYDTLNAGTTPTGTALWYTVATLGVPTVAQPLVNINVAGVTNLWVSQIDSNCESPRTPVTITVHPKPAPPVITLQHYCQYVAAAAIIATPSTTGDMLNYFGLGMPFAGSTSVPTPPTIIPGVDTYYVNETSIYGCVSDKAIDTIRIIPKPSTPITRDTTYCQFTLAPPLTADSSIGSRLNWYLLGKRLLSAPVPSNNLPGDSTWYVSQTINTCEGDSAAISVTTIYKPSFFIAVSSPWVCQFDSLTLSYNGPTLVDAAYAWKLPAGASFVEYNGVKSLNIDSIIEVRFDSVVQNNYVDLHVTDNNGFCAGDTSVRITIIPKPFANSYSKADVCIGDTVTLALAGKSAGASDFVWTVDDMAMDASPELNIISSSSNSGGPFSISWNDSGRHVIQLNTSTDQGCRSLASYDTIDVHTLPDASFKVTLRPGTLCIEDSALFSANDSNYNNSFVWSPARSFNNINKPVAWGTVESVKTIVTLTVTDPFGCVASQNQEIDPGTCCSVVFPNAFTPNGDGNDDFFHPLFNGFHNFHIFRIANRWGQTIFESTNSNMKWDGNFNGVPQDMGVYYYYIKYDCGGNTMEQTGDVTLIR